MTPQIYTSAADCCKQTRRNEGSWAFLRGFIAAALVDALTVKLETPLVSQSLLQNLPSVEIRGPDSKFDGGEFGFFPFATVVPGYTH